MVNLVMRYSHWCVLFVSESAAFSHCEIEGTGDSFGMQQPCTDLCGWSVATQLFAFPFECFRICCYLLHLRRVFVNTLHKSSTRIQPKSVMVVSIDLLRVSWKWLGILSIIPMHSLALSYYGIPSVPQSEHTIERQQTQKFQRIVMVDHDCLLPARMKV